MLTEKFQFPCFKWLQHRHKDGNEIPKLLAAGQSPFTSPKHFKTSICICFIVSESRDWIKTYFVLPPGRTAHLWWVCDHEYKQNSTAGKTKEHSERFLGNFCNNLTSRDDINPDALWTFNVIQPADPCSSTRLSTTPKTSMRTSGCIKIVWLGFKVVGQTLFYGNWNLAFWKKRNSCHILVGPWRQDAKSSL